MRPVHDISALLEGNPYPGRGIVLGTTPDELRSVLVYFIMGRSENSRNRVFARTPDGIRTRAYDPDKLSDPSLVIYNPVRTIGGRTVVTNGDQTDTIYEHLQRGEEFRTALLTRTFEPDAPHYTPRISGLLEADGSYRLSILKTTGGDPPVCCRFFYEYSAPVPGVGHFIHTYSGGENPLPSFAGEPLSVAIGGDHNTFARTIWESLHPENKIALFVRYITLKTREADTVIYNKNELCPGSET